jgi:hypothetical protein
MFGNIINIIKIINIAGVRARCVRSVAADLHLPIHAK